MVFVDPRLHVTSVGMLDDQLASPAHSLTDC